MKTWWISLEGIGAMLLEAEDERTAVEFASEFGAVPPGGTVVACEIYMDKLSPARLEELSRLRQNVILTKADLIAAGVGFKEIPTSKLEGTYRGVI
jgi:hypothetical protein